MKNQRKLFFSLGLLFIVVCCLFVLLFNRTDKNTPTNIYYTITGHISYQDDAMIWEGGQPSSYYTVWLHLNSTNSPFDDSMSNLDNNGDYSIILGCIDKGGKSLRADRTWTISTSGDIDDGYGNIRHGYYITSIDTGISIPIPGDLSGKIISLSMTKPITLYPLIQELPDTGRGICEAYAAAKDITIVGDYTNTASHSEIDNSSLNILPVK